MIGRLIPGARESAERSASREFALACRGSFEPDDLVRGFLEVARKRLGTPDGHLYLEVGEIPTGLLKDLPTGRCVLAGRQAKQFPAGTLLLALGNPQGPPEGLAILSARPEGRPYGPPERSIVESLGRELLQLVQTGRALADRARRERSERQLQQARDVQDWMLARELPPIEGIDLEVVARAATSPSGDFHDVMPVASGRWGILLGEAGGTGFSAALRATIALSYFRSAASGTLSPEELLSIVNNLMCLYPSTVRASLTATYAIYDRRDRSLNIAMAGQDPPLLNGWPMAIGGVPLGLGREAQFTRTVVTLKPGDSLLWYTTGLLEASGGDGEPLGQDGLAAWTRQGLGSDAQALPERLSGLLARHQPACGLTCLAMAVR